jgi:hypothetical protein
LRWTRQRRARGVFAGRVFRERTWRARRTALKRLGRNFFRQHAGRSRRMARGNCGRQNRVVLAPVAGVKLMEIVGPDRAFDQSPIRRRRRPEEFGSGERGISRKTTAQGRSGVPAHLRSAVCILCARLRVSWAPGFPRALCFQEGNCRCTTSGVTRAARSQCRIRCRPGLSWTIPGFFGPHRLRFIRAIRWAVPDAGRLLNGSQQTVVKAPSFSLVFRGLTPVPIEAARQPQLYPICSEIAAHCHPSL